MYKFLFLYFFAIGLSKNALSQVSSATANSGDKIFEKVEREAAFPGGLNAWSSYLQDNLRANVPARKGADTGVYEVVVRFIVAKDGKIKDVKAETNLGYGMEKEVIRIIKKSPNWIPAQMDGRAVNAFRRQPVTFVVTEE